MKRLLLVLGLMLCLLPAWSQEDRTEVAIKTNVLSDAFENVSLGAEVSLAPKWTLDITGDFNFWNLSHSRRWKHAMAQPEARYWFCDRFAGGFLAMQLSGGAYNIGFLKNSIHFLGNDFRELGDYRYQGWFVGAGVGAGYAWVLNRHLNVEAELVLGWAYSRYDKYQCKGCGKKVGNKRVHNYVGPTKAAVSLVYLF